MMNILITGGTGLIGKKLINTINNHNTNITVLTRNAKKASSYFNSPVTFIEKLTLADINNQDTIINLAGEPIADKRWSNAQKNKICQSRWNITEQLTKLIKTADKPPSLFISGSAVGIYGRQSNSSINEDYTQYHLEFTHEVCSTWERLALAAKSSNTRVAILRTGIVLDRNYGALPKMILPFKLGIGGKISSGNQVMSWIHIDDMVAAILHIQKTTSLEGVINLTAEYPVSNKIFSHTLAKTLNRPNLFTTPALVLKIVFGEMADLLLFGQHVIPKKLKNSGFIFKYTTIADALEDLLNKE